MPHHDTSCAPTSSLTSLIFSYFTHTSLPTPLTPPLLTYLIHSLLTSLASRNAHLQWNSMHFAVVIATIRSIFLEKILSSPHIPESTDLVSSQHTSLPLLALIPSPQTDPCMGNRKQFDSTMFDGFSQTNNMIDKTTLLGCNLQRVSRIEVLVHLLEWRQLLGTAPTGIASTNPSHKIWQKSQFHKWHHRRNIKPPGERTTIQIHRRNLTLNLQH